MSITVKKEIIVPAVGDKKDREDRTGCYLYPTGLTRRETRTFHGEDGIPVTEYRYSEDNGRTWGDWVRETPVKQQAYGPVYIHMEHQGEDEFNEGGYPLDQNRWNKVHGHAVSLRFHSVYVGGFEKAAADYWSGGMGEVVHTYLEIRDKQGELLSRQMVAYEDGAAFDQENYRTSGHLSTNFGLGSGLNIMKNGDLLFSMWIPNEVGCRLLGLDVDKVFPSAPRQPDAILAVRAHWEEKEQQYSFTFCPVVLDDRQSSRGISEPVFAELESGRILMVFRASNVIFENWNCRISPYAPCYKFYCLSEDGGKSYSPPMPWHFDTREVVYSPATYSLLLRSEKNGRLYWFGNISDPTETYGNYPRHTLYMVEVDDEWGCAKKETLTRIDGWRDGESEKMEMSNFGVLEDRETGDFEIYVSKYSQFPDRDVRDCETCKYTIILPD